MRCTGGCCRSFRLGNPELLRKREMTGDEFTVATMVIPLGRFAKGAVLPSGDIAPATDLYYDCRHLQPNGDCRIYEDRPTMCRNYPNGQPCQRKGCTYTD